MSEPEEPMLKLMRDFATEKSIPISSAASKFVSQASNGQYNFFNRYMLEETLIFFKRQDPYWITTVDFDVRTHGADLRLELIDASGNSVVILPNSRTPYVHSELVTFKVGHAASQISVISGGEKPVSLATLSISGRNIGELVDLMKSASFTWKNLEYSYQQIREVVASDLEAEKTEVLRLKSESADVESRLSHLKQAIQLDEKQAKTVSKYLSDIESQHNVLTGQVEKLLKDKATLSTSNRKVESELVDRNAQLENISEKLEDTQEKLKAFKSESSLYSEDFSEYKSEINRQNTVYKMILVFLLMVGSVISVNMYDGVRQMSSDLQFNFDIWSLLVSRLPIISLNIFLLGVCSTIFYKMIELLTKNNERLSLTKQVAYLVKECTDSQSEDLILDDEQILKQRISNKMLLIREFINSQSASNFDNSKSPSLDSKFDELKDALLQKKVP